MAVLTPDYERMQNGQPQDFTITKEYREDFKNQDIASAQALITSDNNYLVMDADKLNDLCDTIDYMQQIWADNKEEFVNKYLKTTTPMVVGRNLIDPTKINIDADGITLTSNERGGITINGVATSDFSVTLCAVDSIIPYNNDSVANSQVMGGLFESSSLENPIISINVALQYGSESSSMTIVRGQGEVHASYNSGYIWYFIVKFYEGEIFDNVECIPILACGALHTPYYYGYTGDVQYHLNYTYNTGDLVLYNGVPYFCITDGTTGTWDDSKWIRIGSDDVGLDFVGEYDPPAGYPDGVLVADGETGGVPSRLKLPVIWEYKMNNSFTQCGVTYPNIRYLTSSQTPYTGEIYMTDWNGGVG